MPLLALETATDVCGVALWQGDRLTSEITLRRPRAHAERLVPMVEEALRQASLAVRDLKAVAVSMGPGSYTGLRIGVSTAKGLAAALDVPLVGVPSLEALAAQVAPWADAGDEVCAAFKARREEVYAARFRVIDGAALEEVAPTSVLGLGEISAWLGDVREGRLWLVGEGAPDVARAAGADVRAGAIRLLPTDVAAPSAAWVARLAQERIRRGEREDLAAFEPFYLKAFVAQKPRRTALEKLTF